jgi:glycosyltransferase involved in cell wall biosynthesis
MERGRVPEERITIVRNGPDLDRMRPVAPDPDLRQRGRIIIGYVGVLGFQDGLDYLLRALRHLIIDLGRVDFFCVIIGNGDALDSLKKLAARLGLDEYVWFTGWLTGADLLRCLSTIDIGVSPDPSNAYNDRSTMIKITEYMALGKPVVAFDLPEHRFTAQEAAAYAQPNDELDFARQLAVLMDDPVLRRSLGEIGRRRVEMELAWSHQEALLLRAYERLNGSRTQAAKILKE